MRTVIAIPPLPRMTGGLTVLYQLAERLRETGRSVMVSGPAEAPGLADAADFETYPWDSLPAALGGDDIFVAPEGWPGMMAPAFTAKCRVLAYAQNWAYVFSALPQGVGWQDLPVSFIAVSDPVKRFLEMARLPVAGIVRPCIDAAYGSSGRNEANRPDAAKRLRIAVMPRKNKGLYEQIRQIFSAIDVADCGRTEWVEIHKMARAEVAECLGTCHIFLATGFPEGVGLPPLEAMASGCLVVGFSGFGGWDYMRQAAGDGYRPFIPLWDSGFAPNGFFAADGDVLDAVRLLSQAAAIAREKGSNYFGLQAAGRATAAAYSVDNQRKGVDAVWKGLEEKNVR